MYERLQKIISARGVMSRRAAEELIKNGRVSVNGAIASIGERAEENSEIRIDGKLLPCSSEPVYIVLNKPRGYVTTMTDERGRKTVADLVKNCGVRVYPVGRLDINSEGLLIMTNDGAAAHHFMHPSFESNKTYQVTVSGEIDKGIIQLGKPMIIDDVLISDAKAEILSRGAEKSVISVTIHEGRNRQVRKMCAKAELCVHRLIRVSEGNIRCFKEWTMAIFHTCRAWVCK